MRRLVTIVVALAALGHFAPAKAQTAALPFNGGFELSVAEGSLVGPSPIHGTLIQPVLPTNWTFEGAAGLFDHAHPDPSVNPLEARRPAEGKRFVQISVPLSGAETQCQGIDECEIGIDFAKAVAQLAYSPDPVWRPVEPIAVVAGRSYTLSAKTQLEFATAGTGSFVAIRWLNASAEPIGISNVGKFLWGPNDPCSPGACTKGWSSIATSGRAPAGAAFAVPLLGSTGDLFLASIRFDDVKFL